MEMNVDFSTSENLILQGESLEILKTLNDNSIDLILSDIPYGIGLDSWDVLHSNANSAYGGTSPAQKKAGKIFKKRGKPINGWSSADKKIPKEYYDWCSTWACEWERVLRPGGAAFVFAGRRFAHRCISSMEDAGFNFKDLLGWTRSQVANRAQRLSVVYDKRGEEELATVWKDWRLGNLKPVFEPIIWCFKSYNVTIADNVIEHGLGAYNAVALKKYFGSTDNIFCCNHGSSDRGLHEAQKPLELMKALIELVTIPGQVVLDPFAGSGTTALAATELKRCFVVIERDKKLIKVIEKRIANAQISLNF